MVEIFQQYRTDEEGQVGASLWSMPAKMQKEQVGAVLMQEPQAENVDAAVSMQEPQPENIGAVPMQGQQAENVGLGPQEPTHARFLLDKLFGVGKKGHKEKKSYYNTVNYYYPNKGGYGGGGGYGGYGGGEGGYGGHGGENGYGGGGYGQEYNTYNRFSGDKKGFKKGLFRRSEAKSAELGDVAADNIDDAGSKH